MRQLTARFSFMLLEVIRKVSEWSDSILDLTSLWAGLRVLQMLLEEALPSLRIFNHSRLYIET